jgi:ADP-ribose pyrophosphatase YjhB (NUDIX family)
MPKPRPKIARTRPTKEVSVMAWIEDAEQRVLLVREAAGLRLWTFPGGKVKRGESLVKAIRRELYEETGLRMEIGSLLGVLDRRNKDGLLAGALSTAADGCHGKKSAQLSPIAVSVTHVHRQISEQIRESHTEEIHVSTRTV